MRPAEVKQIGGEGDRTIAADTPVLVLGLTLSAATVAPSLDRGGFTPGGQQLLVALAAVVLLELVLTAPERLTAVLRTPVVPVLILLGVVAALSATWTIGSAGVALRAGLVIVAYGLVAAGACVLAGQIGLRRIAVGLSLLAALEAALGLGACALGERPMAELIGGSWRPEGTFEYAPALGLLQLCGLPAAVRAAASSSRRLVYTGAVGVVLAGVTLGCADSRTDLALAGLALILLGRFADPRQMPRRALLAATCLLTLSVLAGALLLGRHATASAHAGGPGRLAEVAAACVALVALWPLIRRMADRVALRRAALIVVLAIAVGAAIWLVAGYAGTLTSTGNGFGHGRISYWKAAVRAWEHRPLVGSGAGTFARASGRYQVATDRTLFAHDLPLELAAELGLVGFLLGVLLYGAAARTLLQTVSDPDAWLLMPAVACFLLANLVDWPWHLAGLSAAWAVAAGGLARGEAVARWR